MAIILGFGGNLEHKGLAPRKVIEQAFAWLEKHAIHRVKQSSFFQTRPVPDTGQPDFINCIAIVTTPLPADALLACLHECETVFGRTRQDRWQARTLDVDLIDYDGQVLPSKKVWQQIVDHEDPAAFIAEVTLPHPRAHKRAFVLAPLLEIMPDYCHPLIHQSVQQILSAIKDQPIKKLNHDL